MSIACPVGVELAAEVLIGVERHVILENGFQEVQERALARVAFFGHKQEDGQLLNGTEVEQLQVAHAQLVLLAKDVFHQRADAGEVTLLWPVAYRFVEVEKLADYGLVAHVVGYGAETVILGNAADIVLAVVLAQGLVVPRDTFLYIPSVQLWLLHNLVERCADTDKLFLCHAAIRWRQVAVF